MNKQQLILAIANDLADRVKDDKQPYIRLKWIAEYCSYQYLANKSEVTEAYFAAINILKANGVENASAKRKPLTTLSKEQKAWMRKQAKEFTVMVKRFMENSIEVTRRPIKTNAIGIAQIQIALVNNSGTSFYYPTIEGLTSWSLMDESTKVNFAYKFAQQCKTADDCITENLDVIKANLEASL